MGLGIFQDMKLTNGVYTCHGSANPTHGGVSVLYRPSPRYTVEAVQQFRPNIVVFHLEMGGAAMIHCQMLPRLQRHLNDRECRCKECPQGADLMVAGDLNFNLAEPEGDWRED